MLLNAISVEGQIADLHFVVHSSRRTMLKDIIVTGGNWKQVYKIWGFTTSARDKLKRYLKRVSVYSDHSKKLSSAGLFKNLKYIFYAREEHSDDVYDVLLLMMNG